MLTGDELLRKVQSIDLTKEPREQKPPGYYMDLVEKENQQYLYERKLTKQRLLGLPIQGPLTLKQFNRNNL
jgi:hypothetical protein